MLLQRKVVRQVHGPIKKEESWRIGINKEMQDILKGADIVKFKKWLKLRWCRHIE
jgi:hypothetical protein